MSLDLAKAAAKLLSSGQCTSVSQVAEHFLRTGLTSKLLHKATITRALNNFASAAGIELQYVRGRPRKMLSAANKERRLQFVQKHRQDDWNNVLFTDRKKFKFSYPGERVTRGRWVQKGQSYRVNTVNHPQVVNLYAGICRFGVTACHTVAGTSKHRSEFANKQGKPAKNITAAEYKDVLLRTLLPEGERLFRGKGVTAWVLQQDNDPTHRVAEQAVSQFNKERQSRVNLLANWPPNSPDLNPIENFWSWVDAKVNSLGCKTFDEYKDQLLATIKQAPKQMLFKLVTSVPRRLVRARDQLGERINA